jgi:hypothetical protein
MIWSEYSIIFWFINLYIQIITITIHTLYIQQRPHTAVSHIMNPSLVNIHTSAIVGNAITIISFRANVNAIYTEFQLRVSMLQGYWNNRIDHCNSINGFEVINLQIIATMTNIYIFR